MSEKGPYTLVRAIESVGAAEGWLLRGPAVANQDRVYDGDAGNNALSNCNAAFAAGQKTRCKAGMDISYTPEEWKQVSEACKNLRTEREDAAALVEELAAACDKVKCPSCHGLGTSPDPFDTQTTECFGCKGTGKHPRLATTMSHVAAWRKGESVVKRIQAEALGEGANRLEAIGGDYDSSEERDVCDANAATLRSMADELCPPQGKAR